MSDYKECLKGTPFMSLPEDGVAPVLNYNIPQKTAFSVYGTQKLSIPNQFFRKSGIVVSEPQVQNVIKSRDEDLIEMVKKDIESGLNSSNLIININKLDNNKVFLSNPSKILPVDEHFDIDIPQDFKQDALGEVNTTIAKDIGITADLVVEKVRNGYAAVVVDSFFSDKKKLRFIKRPNKGKTKPMIYIMHEFKVASYLGDYGAGKTLRTFSLLPGEKTTISIKSFFESKETKKKSENVLDSFSENSAKNLEEKLEQEANKTISDQESSETINHQAKTSDVNTSLSASGMIYMVNVNASVEANFHNENSEDNVTNTSSAMESSVNSTHEAIKKQTNETNSVREVQIDSESESTQTQSEEKSTVRELVNPNLNRVLNFVFRQLLQEYVTITYLNNIKIVFVNGHPENTIVVPLNELDFLLNNVVEAKFRDKVKEIIFNEFFEIENYNGEFIEFLERKEVELSRITNDANSYSTSVERKAYIRKKVDLEDTYTAGGLKITVPGVILKVAKNTLRTPSVVVDALLGKGDALDCYNQLQQEAKSIKLELENNKLEREIDKMKWEKDRFIRIMDIIETLPDDQKAEALKSVFSSCCSDKDVEINNNLS